MKISCAVSASGCERKKERKEKKQTKERKKERKKDDSSYGKESFNKFQAEGTDMHFVLKKKNLF